MSFSEGQAPPQRFLLHVLMVGFDEPKGSRSCHSVLMSSELKPSIEWVATLQEGHAKWTSGMPYDVIVLDCRKDREEWGQVREIVQGGGKTMILGVTKGSENENAQGYIMENVFGFCVDEMIAPTALKWVLQQAQERKQFLFEQELLRNQMGEAAYKIEMADIASTVLHNVGNVLTSVTIAANMVESVVDQSSVTLVNRMAELLTTHQDDLGTYLTNDPKGKRIPPSLEKLGVHLVEEQQTVLKELKGLVKNIRHMKQIIVSHQTIAKAEGHLEQVALVDVLSHALELSFQPGDAKWMMIHQEYQAVPTVLIDQHQLLQILVNLLRNAKQAMRQQTQGSHELRLSVNYQDSQKPSVVLTIQDTGIGIAPEHLSKMFTRGFTTKKDGNGIGLHSSILAIQKMGGTMDVQSEGVGRGAKFTLTLPIQKEAVLT